MSKIVDSGEAAKMILDRLMKLYYKPIWDFLKGNPHLVPSVPGFLVEPERVVLYFGKKHIAIEYIGPESVEILKDQSHVVMQVFTFQDAERDFLEKILGFPFDGSVALPMPQNGENIVFPNMNAVDIMVNNGWNFEAQNALLAVNSKWFFQEDVFSRIVNGFFFDCDSTGLKTRHIKWMDIIPVNWTDNGDGTEKMALDLSIYSKLAKADIYFTYPIPSDFKFKKLPLINRFIELWSDNLKSEPDITRFLADAQHQFLLTMRFGVKSIYPELVCEWQSQPKDSIKPDFFILNADGYADIVEFKLPRIESNVVVGKANRETFSAWLNAYISQTRVYANYFEDPNNRSWFEKKYGFKVYKPKRWLVVGRRADFDSEVWREIVAEIRDFQIITYDDLVDGVVAQFYK